MWDLQRPRSFSLQAHPTDRPIRLFAPDDNFPFATSSLSSARVLSRCRVSAAHGRCASADVVRFAPIARALHRDWRPHTRTSRLRIPKRPLSDAGDPTFSPAAARSDTNRFHPHWTCGFMRTRRENVRSQLQQLRSRVQNRSEIVRRTRTNHNEHLLRARPRKLNRGSTPLWRQFSQRIRDHDQVRTRPPRSRPYRTAATQRRAQLAFDCSGLRGVPLPNLPIPLHQREAFDCGKTSAAAHIAVPGPAPRSSTERWLATRMRAPRFPGTRANSPQTSLASVLADTLPALPLN